MLFLAESNSGTFLGMKTIFGKTDIFYLGLSVALSLKTCISLHLKSMALSKPFFPFTAKLAALLWTVALIARRMLVLVLYFAPSLGLFNLLHHWKWEQIPFEVRKHRNVTAEDELVFLNDIKPRLWSDIDRWDYFDVPTPPEYTIYTVYTAGDYFKMFWVLLAIQSVINTTLKLWTSPRFRTEAAFLDKILHGLEICNIPFAWKDWDEDAVTVEDHQIQFKAVTKEMLGTIMVNFIFNTVMLLPLFFTGNFQQITTILRPLMLKLLQLETFGHVTKHFWILSALKPRRMNQTEMRPLLLMGHL